MKRFLLVPALLCAFVSGVAAQSPMRATDLRCEYRVNPLGIDEPAPRFSWRLEDARRSAFQQAYRITVDSDSAALASGRASVWDSGKVLSSQTNNVIYQGGEFEPRTRYFWRVEVWDGEGSAAPASGIASFETAMLRPGDWRGYWIDAGGTVDTLPAPYFRREIDVKRKVARARAYITGLGYYRFSINGERVGDELLAPAYTKYDAKVFYQTFDVTPMLRPGANALGVILGNGWFNEQSKAVWVFDKAPWRDVPKFLLNLHIAYDDGTTELVVSDTGWKTAAGPIVFNNIYSGEYYDARLGMPGWDSPGFDDSAWRPASRDALELGQFPSTGELRAQAMPPIRVKAGMEPVAVRKFGDRVYVFDMGKNIAGLSKIRVRGERGTTLQIRHGEKIHPDGRIDLENIAVHFRFEDSTERAQTDRYTLRGGDFEEWMPLFTYHGFQYVEVEADRPVELDAGSLTAYQIYTDIEQGGRFECSDTLVNRILEIGQRSYVSNLHGIFTDCPHREKNGWTGDAQLACEVGMYNFRPILAYEKYVADLREAQAADGQLPGIVPTSGWGYHWGNGPAWDAALIMIPWYVYLYYGDDRLIRDSYASCRRYMDYLAFRAVDDTLDIGLGDWCPYKSQTPVLLTSTLYYYQFASLMSRFAEIVGNGADRERYAALAGRIARKVNDTMLDPATGVYANGTQTAQSAALFQGVVDPAVRDKAAARLVEAVHGAGDHLDVGLLGSKYLLNALTATGNNALAYTVASQPTYPSWGYWITQFGATAMREHWNSAASLNHIMFGEICAWMYKALAGINPDPAAPGYRRILLRPGVDTPLTYVRASAPTVHGDVVCNWEKKGKRLLVETTVPVNTTATLVLPDDGRTLYEGGQKLAPAGSTGIGVSRGGGELRVALGSGGYRFELR